MGTSSVRGVQDELSVQANMMHVRIAYTLGVNCGSPSHQIRELQPRTAELVVEPDTRVVQRQVHVVSVPTENLVFHVNTSISPHGWEIDEKVGDVLLATTIVSERKKPDEHRQAGWQESAQAPDLLVGYPQKIARGRAGKPVKDGIRRISG
jgi:hypothetical protein